MWQSWKSNVGQRDCEGVRVGKAEEERKIRVPI